MEHSTCGKVCSVHSTQEILPVSNFGQLHAHPPSSAIENVTALLLSNKRQNCIQCKMKLVSHDLITTASFHAWVYPETRG